MEISSYLKSKASVIESTLNQLVSEKEVPYNRLYKAARYSLLGSGKRLRPLLTLATVETLGGSEEAALYPACALEMVHTYSLIHDDLPCMDDDDFRRGKPSLHKAFYEGEAVLTGDYLLTYAFEVLSISPHLTESQKIHLIQRMAKHAGSQGMIGGQILDLEAGNTTFDKERLNQIHKLKTGALIVAAIEFGGIIAGGSEQQLTHLKKFGEKIGLAFQIIDDILDVLSIKQKRGATAAVSSDISNNKLTYVKMLGIEEAKEEAVSLSMKALEDLKSLSVKCPLLADLALYIIHRNF